MELKICHLYPDVLNLYGDRGNIICMEKRLQWRGIDVTTTGLPLGEKLNASDFDLFFIGGGQNFDRDALLADLNGGKSEQLKGAVEDGKTLLAICGGYQLLGRYYETLDGRKYELTGILDLYTEEGKNRMTGDYSFLCEEPETTVVGFENHSGRTYLGSGLKPLGKILTGHGNNGTDGTEGVRYNNLFGTYSHGCLLPKNPVLCDYILHTALARKYGQADLQPLNDALEQNAHDYMEHRLSAK